MNWKCFFGHKFIEENRKVTNVWGYSGKYPIDIYTEFLFKCSNCQKMKVEKLNGSWGKDIDDDDDDDREKMPVMSPDDFYESIGK